MTGLSTEVERKGSAEPIAKWTEHDVQDSLACAFGVGRREPWKYWSKGMALSRLGLEGFLDLVPALNSLDSES